MTMLSFRLEDAAAEEVQRWADRLSVDRSELLRQALRGYILRLRSETDAETWADHPASDEEMSLAAVADWGPSEDWSDWSDATR